MANVSWTLGTPNRTSSTWNRSPSATPWSGLPANEPLYPGQVAANADLVTLDTGGGNGSSYTVTVNVSADIAGLTMSGSVTPTRTTKLVMTAGNTLNVSGGITLSDVNSIIDGSGTISVGGVIGNSGTIVPGIGSGGTLVLTGAGSIASGVLTQNGHQRDEPAAARSRRRGHLRGPDLHDEQQPDAAGLER